MDFLRMKLKKRDAFSIKGASVKIRMDKTRTI